VQCQVSASWLACARMYFSDEIWAHANVFDGEEGRP